MRPAALSLLSVLLLAALPGAASARGFPRRNSDAIVLTGSKVPSLIGEKPRRIVAFKFAHRRWKQVPVQVDERAQIDYAAVRDGNQASGRPFSHLAYADAGTLAGADPDPMLDGDDEIAAMAKDSGGSAAGKKGKKSPKGVIGSSRVRIRLSDPLQPKIDRYIYLFRSHGRLKPSAGRSYVDYKFSLDSGDYEDTYDFSGVADNGNGLPANLENSTVKTRYYKQHLLARWVEDALKIRAGDATGVDILDGDKDQVFFGCARSELTFSRGGGGFIANKSGPVRAIRSYIGANSGTYTQQDHVYYQRGDVTKTYLRVHAGIATISQFLDYSPAASGMTYRNNHNRSGVTIDGSPETPVAGRPNWEQVTGAQGSASIINRVDTNLPDFATTNYYDDGGASPMYQQCGGYADDQTFGASGSTITSTGDNTDPTLVPGSYPKAYSLTGRREVFYDGPGAKTAVAALRAHQADSRLSLRAHAVN